MSFPEEQPEPEEQPAAEEPTASEEQSPQEDLFPEETVLPEDFTPIDTSAPLPRARRRRAHRTLVMPTASDRAGVLDSLARRAFPSFEFFLFALLCGAILGAAYLLDAPALLLLGSLLAPLLTPWVGMVLAIQTGSWRFFFLTLGGVLVAGALVFLTGALAGLAGQLWAPLQLFYAGIHTHLWVPDLFLVVLGAVLLTISFVQSEKKPILPSIMLAYELFLPLSAAGVGFGIGIQALWQYGLQIFAVHLALGTLVGVITLAAMRFKPTRLFGHLLPILIWLITLAVLVYITGAVDAVRNAIVETRRVAPTPTPLVIPTNTATATPTATPTSTPTATRTVLPTATLEPTPAYAVISAPAQFGGAYLRSEPAGPVTLATLSNGITVEVLPQVQTVNGIDWTQVRWEAQTGWVLSSVLTAATAPPPSPTP